MLPGVTADESQQEVTSEDLDDAYESADQLGAELVTLSLLPESRWKCLLNLDEIKVGPDGFQLSDQSHTSRKHSLFM